MEKTRADEILDALLDALRERGLPKVTLEDVGERLGLSKSAIYHYFAGKAQMLRALLIREFGRRQSRMEQAADNAATPAGKLEAIIHARISFLQRKGGAASWSLDSLLSVAHLAREFQASLYESERDLFATILRQGVERGEFVIDDVDAMADILVCTLQSVEESMMMHHKALSPAKAQTALTRLWLRGLLARPK